MRRARTYSDAELAAALATARSWRGVLRALGLDATSGGAIRSVRTRADRLGLDHSHLIGGRRWTDAELASAVASERTWPAVADRLALAAGASTAALKGHCARLGIDVTHLSVVERHPETVVKPSLAHLPRAGSALAAGWLALCGYEVSWPLEPAVYDLLVRRDSAFERVQVKTTSRRAGRTWVVRLTRSSQGQRPYDVADIDSFAVVDGDLHVYLIPAAVVGGLQAVHVSAYAGYRLLPPT